MSEAEREAIITLIECAFLVDENQNDHTISCGTLHRCLVDIMEVLSGD